MPGLGTAAGLIVGGLVGLIGTKLGGMAGRKLGEKIGSAVAGDDEEQLSETLEDQLPAGTIPAETLPPEITNQYMSGEPKYSGVQTTATLEGAADVNLHLTLDDNRAKVSATTSRNTARNIRVNTGSVIEAREML